MLSATAAGAAFGALLGFATSHVPLAVRALAATVLYAAVAALALANRRNTMPQRNRETEQSLLSRGPLAWAVINSAQLGLGFTSRIGFWSWYLMPLGIALAGDWRVGACVWGAYGAGRLGMAVGMAYLSGSPEGLHTGSYALLSRRPAAALWTRRITVGLAAALAVVAAV
jgi:hypothetical protein